MPNMWRSTNPTNPLLLSTTTFILYIPLSAPSAAKDRYPHRDKDHRRNKKRKTIRAYAGRNQTKTERDSQQPAKTAILYQTAAVKLLSAYKKAPPFTEFPVRVIPVYTEVPKSVPYLFSGVYSTISAQPIFTRISARFEMIELLTPINGEPADRFCWYNGYSKPS